MPRLIGELSSDEAIELAAQVAELARAGLPLSGGLRALAEEVGGGRLTRVLGSMADQLDEGATLGEVILAHHDVLPLHIRGLLTAAIKSGRLPEAMHEFVDIQRKRAELRRRVWLALAYPTLLAAMLVGLFVFVLGVVVPEFVAMYRNVDANLPPATALLVWLSGPGAKAIISGISFLVAAYFMLWIMPGASWPRRLLYHIPLF